VEPRTKTVKVTFTGANQQVFNANPRRRALTVGVPTGARVQIAFGEDATTNGFGACSSAGVAFTCTRETHGMDLTLPVFVSNTAAETCTLVELSDP
jgi:hypothetical protein